MCARPLSRAPVLSSRRFGRRAATSADCHREDPARRPAERLEAAVRPPEPGHRRRPHPRRRVGPRARDGAGGPDGGGAGPGDAAGALPPQRAAARQPQQRRLPARRGELQGGGGGPRRARRAPGGVCRQVLHHHGGRGHRLPGGRPLLQGVRPRLRDQGAPRCDARAASLSWLGHEACRFFFCGWEQWRRPSCWGSPPPVPTPLRSPPASDPSAR